MHRGRPAAGRRYGPLRALYLSFFSGDLYRDVADHWRGLVFGYLAILLAVCWLLAVVMLHFRFSYWVESEAPRVVDKIPTLRWSNGVLQAEVEQPYSIVDEETGEVLAVIDTTGQIATLEQAAGARVLLTKSEAIVQQSPNEVRVYRYEPLGNLVVDQSFIHLWLGRAARWLGFVVFPLALGVSYLYRLCQSLVYAAIGILFAKILSADLTYPAAHRLAMVAVTPAILLHSATDLAGVSHPASWALWLFVATGYLFFAVHCSVSSLATFPHPMRVPPRRPISRQPANRSRVVRPSQPNRPVSSSPSSPRPSGR